MNVKVRDYMRLIETSAAVYYLYFVGEEDRKYYGSTKNLRNRFGDHVCALRCRWHPNLFLREACDKYGLENLRVAIVKREKDSRLERALIKNDPQCLNVRGNKDTESHSNLSFRLLKRKHELEQQIARLNNELVDVLHQLKQLDVSV